MTIITLSSNSHLSSPVIGPEHKAISHPVVSPVDTGQSGLT